MQLEQIVLAAMVIVPLVCGIAISLIPASRESWARPAALVVTGAAPAFCAGANLDSLINATADSLGASPG